MVPARPSRTSASRSSTRSPGNQPLYSKDRKLSLAINGEIYNHKELRAGINDESKFRTYSDCEPVVHLYEQIRHEVASKLDGDFAFRHRRRGERRGVRGA